MHGKNPQTCPFTELFCPFWVILHAHPYFLEYALLNECITFVIELGDKICEFLSLYHYPNQSKYDFETFCSNFEIILDVLLAATPLITAIGDSNAKSNNCDTTSFEGYKAKTITSKFGLQKIIEEPTHNQGKSATCIDLIFTSKLNLVMDSGIYLSLHQKYQHQIVFATFSLKDHYQPSGKHEVWR